MPIMCITIVLLPTEDIFFQYNDKLYSYIINIITYANHALNKIIYPFIKIYYERDIFQQEINSCIFLLKIG